MFKYNILKRVIIKDQNVLNMQKITHWSATYATLLTQCLCINSELYQ